MYNYNSIISACLLALLLSCSGNFEPIPYENRAKASSVTSSSSSEASSSSTEESSSSFIASSSSAGQSSSSSSVIASSSSAGQSSSSLGCTISQDEKRTHYCSNGTKKEYGTAIKTISGGSPIYYNTVEIDNQIWMAENLRNSVPYSQCANSYDANCEEYGRLYSLDMAKNDLCPPGFHLPSRTELQWLLERVVDKDARKLKATSGWEERGNGTDDFGFEAKPAGYYNDSDKFQNYGKEGYWWIDDDAVSNVFKMVFNSNEVTFDKRDRNIDLVSVRCVKKK